ncbi:succinate receptor 1-like isoform X2 [Narcine bancroftii]
MDINPQLEKYYLPTVYGIQFIFGFLGNFIVILVYLFSLKDWKSCNIYLFNLSISDLLFTCTLPWLVHYYSNTNCQIYKHHFCIINKYILYFNMYGSILFLTCISVDRYHLVLNPLKFHWLQKKVNAVLICMSIWVFVIIELLPLGTIFSGVNTNNSRDCICSDFASSGEALGNLIYSLYLTIFGFLAPLCIMLFVYNRIVRSLKKMKQESRIPLRKPCRIVVLAITIFIVLLTPYHIMRNIRIMSRIDVVEMSECDKSVVKAVYTITRPVAFFNSVINPVFYFMLGDKFQDQIVNLLQKIFLRMPEAENKKESHAAKVTNSIEGSDEIAL